MPKVGCLKQRWRGGMNYGGYDDCQLLSYGWEEDWDENGNQGNPLDGFVFSLRARVLGMERALLIER